MAAAITDKTSELQSPCGLRNAFAPHAEQVGDQVLCDDQFTRGNPIKGSEQPAAQLLIHLMVSIARGILGQ